MAQGTCGEEVKCYRVLMRKAIGKSPLGRPRRRWEDKIKKKK